MDFLNDTLLSKLSPRKKTPQTDETPPADPAKFTRKPVHPSAFAPPVKHRISDSDIVSQSEPKKRSTPPRINLYCPPELLDEFRQACADDGYRMSTLVQSWVSSYLKMRKEGGCENN